MKFFWTKLRPFLGLVIMDIFMGIIWIYSMQWTFRGMDNVYLGIALNIILSILYLVCVFVRYYILYQRHGVDDVTGGNNKREFERIASGLITNEESYVMVYANIDRFKLINDMYGNTIGDSILKKVHAIINEELRWDEVSGRIMADNFGMLMRFHSIEKLDQRLYRISWQIRNLRDESEAPYGITLTYGIYIVEAEDVLLESVMECANLARANVIKNAHQVAMGIYDESAKKQLSRERELEMKMHKALDNGEFVPFLQPKYELKNETVAGAEALVRWIDPVEGMIFPNDFIPLFEKNGFIVQLDLFMFEEVCKLVDRWESAGCRIIPISVNLSRANFAIPNFFDAYKHIVKKYDVPKGSIEFEFTESLLYNNFEALNDLVNEIHDLGFSCSIDDFGSGYSSLNMLKDVRVDVLKLDRVFFSQGDNSRRGQDVIRSVLGLAQALQLRTVSEGVELQDQVDYLREMNCDFVQGYIFAKPMKVTAFERLVYLEENV